MKVISTIQLLIVSLVVLSVNPAVSGNLEDKLGFTLPAPERMDHKVYLGLTDHNSFQLGQITSDVVIIEIFSMYCPVCQREAAHVNELYSLIENNPKLKDRVKLIGIGAGNSSFEVSFFRKKYDIRFPLFSDADFFIHKKIGEVRTPHFFGLNLLKDGSFTVFYSESGEMPDPDQFLNMLLNKSRLKN